MKTSPVNNDVYTDFNQFQDMKTQAREGNDDALEKVANQFEAYFIKMLLKDLNSTSITGDESGAQEREMYQNLFNDQLSIHLSGGGGIGIADLIKRQIMEFSENISKSKKSGGFSIQKGQTEFRTPVDFITSITNLVEEELKSVGYSNQTDLTKTILAQSILETGWGKHIIHHPDGRSSHNLFNIKANSSWSGEKVQVPTLEFNQSHTVKSKEIFRSYDSFRSSVQDYINLMSTSPRYANVIPDFDSPSNYLKTLQKSGYASDPDYAKKIMQILEQI